MERRHQHVKHTWPYPRMDEGYWHSHELGSGAWLYVHLDYIQRMHVTDAHREDPDWPVYGETLVVDMQDRQDESLKKLRKELDGGA